MSTEVQLQNIPPLSRAVLLIVLRGTAVEHMRDIVADSLCNAYKSHHNGV